MMEEIKNGVYTFEEDGKGGYGTKSVRTYKDDILHGTSKDYDTYIFVDSAQKDFDKQELLILERNFENGKLNGKSTIYIYEGKRLIGESEKTYKDDVLHGTVKEYSHHYGQRDLLSVSEYKDGELDGVVTEYFSKKEARSSEKKIKKRSEYKKGKLDGVVEEFAINGTSKSKKFYKDGVRDVGAEIEAVGKRFASVAKKTATTVKENIEKKR